MSSVLAIIGLLALVVFLVSLVGGLIFKKNRGRRVKLYVPGALAVFIVCMVAVSYLANGEAVQAGFEDAADKRAAEAAGIVDPATWKEQRAAVLAEQQKQRAAADAKSAEAKAAADLVKQKADAEKAAADAKVAADKASAAAKAAEAELATCRDDLSCMGEKATTIAILSGCSRYIESMAKYEYKWRDGFLDPKFSHYRWADKKKGVVTVLGDQVSFQNGFGANVPMVYECDVDVPNDKLVDVRVNEGRLPVS